MKKVRHLLVQLHVAQRHACATIEPTVGAMVLRNPSESILRPIRYLDLQLRLHFQSSWLLPFSLSQPLYHEYTYRVSLYLPFNLATLGWTNTDTSDIA